MTPLDNLPDSSQDDHWMDGVRWLDGTLGKERIKTKNGSRHTDWHVSLADVELGHGTLFL